MLKNTEKKNDELITNGFLKIPLTVLQNRDLAILESIVEYLRDFRGLRYSEIARLLNRDSRTIWTVYNRAKKKLK